MHKLYFTIGILLLSSWQAAIAQNPLPPCPCPAVPAWAADSQSLELLGGTAYNFKTHLEVEQSGQPDIGFSAKYDTKPFTSPWYYDARYAKWNNGKAWEIELLHHKLYLDNNPPEIQNFEVTHGYNHLMYNRARLMDNGLIFRYGGGIVITDTESTVRNLSEDDGYKLSGACAQVAVGKRFYFSKNWFGTLEGKLTAAYARVSVAEGHATVPNVAVHALLGVGYTF